MEHEVSAANKLNDEEEARGRLEAGVQAHQERVVRSRLENMFLSLNPINVLERR